MANYVQNTRGLLESLSDFWLLYFKDLDQLKALYEGTDILFGQAYLDMLSLLLNNSVQDTPLFNKEYFKLLQIKETDLTFSQRKNADQSRYVMAPSALAAGNVVDAKALNNKILDVTASLERGVDFSVTPLRTFEFRIDPLNAYLSKTFGAYSSAFTLRTKRGRARPLSVWLHDNGTYPPRVSREETGTRIEIAYEGPLHGGRGTARALVSAINTHAEIRSLLRATLTFTEGGGDAPTGTDGYVPLARQAVGPLDGFAVRHLEQSFGGKFTASSVGSWIEQGVEKGDILRFLPGASLGLSREFPIALVRPEALYVAPQGVLDGLLSRSGISFSILREPAESRITGQPLHATGQVVQSGQVGQVDAATRTFTAPTGQFSKVHIDDLLELRGNENKSVERILDVLDAHTVVLGSTTLITEVPVAWSLHTSVETATIHADGVLSVASDGTLFFLTTTPTFQPAVTGTVLKVWRNQRLESFAILGYDTARKVRLQGNLLDSAGQPQGIDTGLTWGWARFIAEPTTVAYPHIKADTAVVHARRLVDNGAVEEGRDYVVLDDRAIIRPRSVWRTERNPTVDYNYRIHVIAPTQPAAYESGILTTEGVSAFIQEIAVWALDAQVDRMHLYTKFGYLLKRKSASSEAYRALIRGTFQLFMLGPTLERFEAAINTVAGLGVIRDAGEILLDYDTGALQHGQDGYLSLDTQTFTAKSAQFSAATLADSIYIANGLQENRLYRIRAILSPTQVRLEGVATSDGPLEWELTRRGVQTVLTSKRSYAFSRTVPLRSGVTDPAARGVKIFRAFEVLTDVFEVTDAMESPTWWERIRIPEELWPGQSPTRRQSTPALVENVIGPYDEAAIGDPGLLIGADSVGFVPDPTTQAVALRHKAAFVVLDTWLKHQLFYVSFNPVLLGILSADLIQDLESLVFVAKPAYTYLVLSPSSLLKDLVRVTDTVSYGVSSMLGGPRGEEIVVSRQEPLRIGEAWQVGQWYRHLHAQGMAHAVAGMPLEISLWTPEANARATFTQIYLQGLVGGSLAPILRPVAGPAPGQLRAGLLTVQTPVFRDAHLGLLLEVAGQRVPIGQVQSPTEVRLAAELDDADSVSWTLLSQGSRHGALYAGGLFVDHLAQHVFTEADLGTHIRFLNADGKGNQVLEIVSTWPSAPYQCGVLLRESFQDKEGPWEHVYEQVQLEEGRARVAASAVATSGALPYEAWGYREPLVAHFADFQPAQGDTHYSIGMRHVHGPRVRSRSSQEVDLQESPIQITRMTPPS